MPPILLLATLCVTANGLPGGWTLAAKYEGGTFFDGFDLVREERNYVVWVNESEARRLGLIGVDGATGQAFIRAEHKEKVGDGNGRRAVRLRAKQQYSKGLFVLDATHMPQGCGAHYAWWLIGPSWPSNGEIDVVECINRDAKARHTLHSGPGCSMEGADAAAFTGKWSSSDRFCNVTHSDNRGCGIISDDTASCGKSFNELGDGSVFVTQLLRGSAYPEARIASWFFRRCAVPDDLVAEAPNPSRWGKPYALHPLGDNCSPDHFNDLRMTLSINFCGWAGSAGEWDGPNGCGAETGASTCEEWVGNHPSEFSSARFDVNHVKIYQWAEAPPDVVV